MLIFPHHHGAETFSYGTIMWVSLRFYHGGGVFFCPFQRFDRDRHWRRDEPIRLCCFSFFGHLKTSDFHHHHRRSAFLSSSSSENTGATITAPTQKHNEAPNRTQKWPNAAAKMTWDPSQDDPGINKPNMPPPRKTTLNASRSAYLWIDRKMTNGLGPDSHRIRSPRVGVGF